MEEFKTPLKRPDGTIGYQIMGKRALERYLVMAQFLGITEEADMLRLTSTGKRMVRAQGANFNGLLFDAIERAWQSLKVSTDMVERVVSDRIRTFRVPHKRGVYGDIYLVAQDPIPVGLFHALLDLTGYVGALKMANEPTFFPASAVSAD
jgi:hypothetical protein